MYIVEERRAEYSPIEVKVLAGTGWRTGRKNLHPALLRLENWGKRGSNVQVYWQGRVD